MSAPEWTCEVVTEWRGDRIVAQCGELARVGYRAMMGGWMPLCDHHAVKHATITEPLPPKDSPAAHNHKLWPEPEWMQRYFDEKQDRKAVARAWALETRRRRVRLGLSRADLAARAGYAEGTIACAESGASSERLRRRVDAALADAEAAP